MPKRQRGDDDDGDRDPPPLMDSGGPTLGQQTSYIKNKLVRSEKYAKLKHKLKKAKKAERKKRQEEEAKAEDLGLEAPPRKQQRTIENTREKDVTMVAPGDEEVALDEDDDEFAAHFTRQREPKVLITTCYKPSAIMFAFLSEMMETLPCAEYYKRQGFPLKKIVQFAGNREYTDLIVFNEDRKGVNGLLLVHLPGGPTAHFRISNLTLGRDIKGHGRATSHRPELVLNHFDTRLGRRVGRMLASLFHQDPQFRGRRVATFHNQRDFIFFRHHRYIFEEKEKRVAAPAGGGKGAAPAKQKVVQARLQELGPRFTLKLQSLQKGTFDSRGGEFEWVHKKKEMDTSRRRFHL
ncbi:MAG: anticodon-binding protein [Monoraphidium minutum]|nr:MAG: anticodon-binding protein [Monoraphidium minutum]